MKELVDAIISWRTLLGAVVIFGFVPGFVLRLLVSIYPKDDPRRRELVAQLYTLKRVERLFFVAEQLETVLFDGLPARFASMRRRLRIRRLRIKLLFLKSGSGAPMEEEIADELVRKFLGTASPPAFRLATMLAAIPVDLRVARFILATCVPEAGLEHLTEVFASGLLRPTRDLPDGEPEDDVMYNFPEGVRAVLLSGARRSEVARVVRAASEYASKWMLALRSDPDRYAHITSEMLIPGADGNVCDSSESARGTTVGASEAEFDAHPSLLADLSLLSHLLVGVTDPQLPELARRAAGPGVPAVSGDAWDIFSYLMEFCARADGMPPALSFLDLLARHVGGEFGSVLLAVYERQVGHLGLKS